MSAGVLVVDDDPALLRAIARGLSAAGFDVTACADGPTAARLVTMQSFAVVVSDIDMPELDGVGLLSLLRQRGMDTPVILMTGSPSLETAIRAVEHGAFKYLTKPVALDQLVDAATRAARSRRSRAGVSAGVVLGERYRLTRLLGEGGMSQVWEALHERTGRQVAVKVLHAALNAKPEMRQRLLREARVASTLGHPNVVDVWDLFELDDGTPVLVMELLRGRTLRQHFTALGAIGLTAAADLLVPVVSAVGTAHARGVVHRDLKPENIFLADAGDRLVVKVLDFGIAKLVSPDPQGDAAALTVTGVPLGTPGYMAPEQAFGERDVDCRADVWSLGAMLYEALAGVRPVEASNVGQALKVLMVDGILPLVRRRPELPQGIGSLVDRMLTRERSERPGDLGGVFAELSRYAGIAAPAFGPPSSQAPATSGAAPSEDDHFARTEPSDAVLPRK